MIADGWEKVSSFYENDTLDYTFTKTIGYAVYTFRLWDKNGRNSGISYLNLKVDDPAAHRANAEAGMSFIIAD